MPREPYYREGMSLRLALIGFVIVVVVAYRATRVKGGSYDPKTAI
jgi:hypothetical protein